MPTFYIVIKMKNKKYHTVGTIPMAKIKIVEGENIDTSNTHIHDCSLAWLGTSNTHIHDCSLAWLGTSNTHIHDCSLA
jgi:hypothetical protein